MFSPVDGPLRSLYEEHGIPVMVDRHPLWDVTTFKEYEEAVGAFSSKCLSWGAELVYANTLQSFYAVAAAHEAALPRCGIREKASHGRPILIICLTVSFKRPTIVLHGPIGWSLWPMQLATPMRRSTRDTILR